GQNCFDFELDKGFLEQYEETEIQDAKLKAYVEAEKTSSHIDITVRITGVIDIACTRCLGVFSYPIDCENRLLVKFGQTDDESDPDIIIIPKDKHELNLMQYFYEYIFLALPIKRVHPDDKNGESTCDKEMIKKLSEYIVNGEGLADPRWDKLRCLMKN
ncbi:MAG: DUF177 domain-containing protein, partial [Bacteroidales bacterium]|nr:DUF177 domain-containing protein [Bacteroidales bacterium]